MHRLRDPVWGAIGAASGIAGVVVAILATSGGWPSAGHSAISRSPRDSASSGVASASAPSSTVPTAGGYTDRIVTLTPNGACGRTEVDLDVPDVRKLDPTDSGFGDHLDFSYHACKEGLTYPTSDVIRLGRSSSGTPTRDQCAADARSNALGDPEPIAAVQAGNTLCAITSQGAVAWITVRGRGAPFHGELPTLTLAVTLWR